MAKAKDNFRIEMTEMTNAETRVITVTISAPVQEFMLADLLRKRGVLSHPETHLRQAVREAMQRHLDGAEELIASLVAGHNKTNGAGKAKGQAETRETGQALAKEPKTEERKDGELHTTEMTENSVMEMERSAYANSE